MLNYLAFEGDTQFLLNCDVFPLYSMASSVYRNTVIVARHPMTLLVSTTVVVRRRRSRREGERV